MLCFVIDHKLSSLCKLFSNSEMESRNKFEMCRLCLCENDCFVNIFERNEWQGYVASEVISDLLQFQVSQTDGYTHVVCLTCLTKLTDFRQFKECCQKSKDTYDKMFVSHGNLVEHNPEMVDFVAVKAEPIYYSDHEDNDSKVELTLVETVTHPKYLQCSENKRPHCTSNGDADADSCSNDDSKLEKSKDISLCEDVVASCSRTMENLHGQRILQGQSMYMVPLIQQDISIGKEMKKERWRMEENVTGEGEGWKRTCPDKGVIERREGLECFHCGIVLLSKHSLIQHMEVHGFVNSYECDICDKVFRFNSDFIRHGLSHTDSMWFNRTKCSFGEKGSLRLQQGSKPYKCAKCSKCFSQSGSLNRHIRLHTGSKQYKCADCSKCFNQNGNLNKHMSTHTGSKPYKCTECSKCFSESGSLNRHIRLHTGSKQYKCADCSKCFNQKGNLNKHMSTHTGSKPYKCTECSKCFSESGNLNIHMRTHTGSKPYKCSESSKCFSQICNLNRHMRIHTGSKPYKCATCNKSFSEKGNLNKHLRTHTGLKPYKCAKCGKCFKHNGHLTVHMRLHAGSKP